MKLEWVIGFGLTGGWSIAEKEKCNLNSPVPASEVKPHKKESSQNNVSENKRKTIKKQTSKQC